MSDSFVGLPPSPPFFYPIPIISGSCGFGSSLTYPNEGGGVVCITNIDVAFAGSVAVGAVYATGRGGETFWTDQATDPSSLHLYMSWRGLHFLNPLDSVSVTVLITATCGVSVTGWWMPLVAAE